MKRNTEPTIQKEANKILLLTVLAGAMASCDSVLDYNEGDCSIEYLVKFKYDYNMEKVDAFAQEVRAVTLYAFMIMEIWYISKQTKAKY